MTFWHNPLFTLGLARRKRRWLPGMLVLGGISVFGMIWLVSSREVFYRPGLSPLGTCLGGVLAMTALAAAISAPLAGPVLLSSGVERTRARGMWELLCITTLGGTRIVDALLVSFLIQLPIWIPVVALSLAGGYAQFLASEHAYLGSLTPEGVAARAGMAVALGLYPAALTLANIEIALAASVRVRGRGPALGTALAAIAAVQLAGAMLGLVPACDATLSPGLAGYYGRRAISLGLVVAQALAVAYQVFLFLASRALAARWAERGDEA